MQDADKSIQYAEVNTDKPIKNKKIPKIVIMIAIILTMLLGNKLVLGLTMFSNDQLAEYEAIQTFTGGKAISIHKAYDILNKYYIGTVTSDYSTELLGDYKSNSLFEVDHMRSLYSDNSAKFGHPSHLSPKQLKFSIDRLTHDVYAYYDDTDIVLNHGIYNLHLSSKINTILHVIKTIFIANAAVPDYGSYTTNNKVLVLNMITGEVEICGEMIVKHGGLYGEGYGFVEGFS